MKIEEKLFRVWYYFRTGYGIYLAFILTIVSFITTTYYLAINNIPSLVNVFPNVIVYAIFVVVILPPLATIIGWIHMKKSLAYPSQMVVGIESNPYTYMIQPGISSEVAWPNILLQMEMMEALLKGVGCFTPELEEQLNIMKDKARSLLRGEMVEGAPKELRISKR